MNPFLFIVGCARSGTTLLQRIVNAHPLIAVPPETHWIPRFFKKRIGLTADGFVTKQIIPELLAYHRFPQMGIGKKDLERLLDKDHPVSYSTFVSRIFNLYGERQNKKFVVDKTPAYIRNISILQSLFPLAKFVHLIRDGRDVCTSAMSWRFVGSTMSHVSDRWKENPVAALALWWKRNVQFGREAGGVLGSRIYYEIRYEKLVEVPAEECRKLCDFLGVSFHDSMLTFHEGKTLDDEMLSAKKAWLPITPGLRNWRKEMSPKDIETFEAASGDLLEELGYERMYPDPSSDISGDVQRMQEIFTADLISHRQRLPSGW